MVVTLQILLDTLDEQRLTKQQLQALNSELNTLCHKIENIGYVSAELFVDNQSMSGAEIEEYE